MFQTLVLYSSTHGHTAKIAARIAERLEDAGAVVHLRVVDPHQDISPVDYDSVVIGASVHAGHHQPEIVGWATRHATTLSRIPSAFFSVSMSAARDEAAARRYVDEFVETTGWTPGHSECLAGALQYREYNFVTRLMVRSLMGRDGLPTDTSRDHDFTEWDAVDRFADRCSRSRAVRRRPMTSPASVDLYWIPLGAGGRSVRLNGKVYEALAARHAHRAALRPLPLGAPHRCRRREVHGRGRRPRRTRTLRGAEWSPAEPSGAAGSAGYGCSGTRSAAGVEARSPTSPRPWAERTG